MLEYGDILWLTEKGVNGTEAGAHRAPHAVNIYKGEAYAYLDTKGRRDCRGGR